MGIRIEICGGIASGKTTLATLLGGLEENVVLEAYAENPFLRKFYANPERYAFETEISFLIQHYSQIRDVFGADGIYAFDFSSLQDMAYADINLSSDRLFAFKVLYRLVVKEIRNPDMIVHLICSSKEELNRIQNRGRSTELSIQVDYLDSINRAVESRVSRLPSSVRIVQIDSERDDFANDQIDREKWRRRILEIAYTLLHESDRA